MKHKISVYYPNLGLNNRELLLGERLQADIEEYFECSRNELHEIFKVVIDVALNERAFKVHRLSILLSDILDDLDSLENSVRWLGLEECDKNILKVIVFFEKISIKNKYFIINDICS